MMDMLVTLLPEPDSPTIPRVLPRSSWKDTPSTARTTPSSVLNRTRRSLTSRYGPEAGLEGEVVMVVLRQLSFTRGSIVA